MKLQQLFECQKCGAQSVKWQGRCLDCGAWGSLAAVRAESAKSQTSSPDVPLPELVSLEHLPELAVQRQSTGFGELDRVFGGGIVPGSLTLIGGDPGIGKSTLVMQAACNLSGDVLYISGEESAQQIKLRADRLGAATKKLRVCCEEDVDAIVAVIRKTKPQLAIIDSIQTVFSSDVTSEAGSVNQIRAACLRFLEVSKKENIPIWLIGHVTKDGSLGGPKTLEHYVDVVLYIEGDEQHGFRLVRATKNRFGSTSEVGMFEMTGQGLREVQNPSAYFLHQRPTPVPGSVFTVIMEGRRPIVLEVQALVTRTVFGMPQRRASGFDRNRLELLLAVLEKHGLSMSSSDVHINIVGGLRVSEPAVDLAVVGAIISASSNRPWDPSTAFLGEVGLTGEVRPATGLDLRVEEAYRVGVGRLIGGKPSKRLDLSTTNNITFFPISSLREAISLLREPAVIQSTLTR